MVARQGHARSPARPRLAAPCASSAASSRPGASTSATTSGRSAAILEGQERGDPAIYCIVDLHATSVSYDPDALPGYVLDTTAMLIAAGLDPERCILFRQSDVAEHSELCWLLASVTPYGDLQRMTQFKDKSRASSSSCAPACSSIPCSRPRTSCSTRPTRCRWARTSASTSSSRARSRGGSTPRTARCSSSRRPSSRRPARASWIFRTRSRRCPRRRVPTPVASTSTTSPRRSSRRSSGRRPTRAPTSSARPTRPGITNLIDIYAVARGVEPEEVEREFAGQG